MGDSRRQRTAREYFCAEVLRLPPGVIKPDLYTLLGLGFFEPDHGTIVRAAMERAGVLEACLADTRPGHEKALRGLIKEIREARLTLLDPKRRKAYDATLIGHREEEKKQEHIDVDLRPGTMVAGRYRVLGERRAGGFGKVYDALDSNLRTRVELSVLRPSLSKDKASRRRAERAARAAAALDHPGIVRVDEVGEAEGLLFVRTRQLLGKSLLEAIEATPKMRFDADLARETGQQLAEALAYAHERDVTHGDLRPHNVVVGAEGRVAIVDFRVSRAIQDALGIDPPRSRPPGEEDAPPADLFGLGCVLYQMLAGMPPFAQRGSTQMRELPGDVPDDLAGLTRSLLHPDPAKRPGSAAEVAGRLAPRSATRRMPALIGTAAVLIVALVAVLLARGGGDGEASARGQAWELIARGQLDQAIRHLKEAREQSPEDRSLDAPLADALDRKAGELEKAGDIQSAQELLAEAQSIAPDEARQKRLERLAAESVARLKGIVVRIDAVTAKPVVTAAVGRDFSGRVQIGGADAAIENGVARRALDLSEGPHEIPYLLEDRIGNAHQGSLLTIVDRTPPTISILEPEPGALFRTAGVKVRVAVSDANLPTVVTVQARELFLVDKQASSVFKLTDGEHVLVATVTDRAGLVATVRVRVIVDTTAPDLEVATNRIVTKDGAATIRGTLTTNGATVAVDGTPVELKERRFAATVRVAADRFVPVEATGPTGIRRQIPVQVVIDSRGPRVKLGWGRRDRNGILLYGTKEMDAKGLRLRVRIEDKTRVTLRPIHGAMAGNDWVVPAHEGRRQVRLVAVDEAGNETAVVATIEGHRAAPRLDVKNATSPITADEEAILEIEADGTLTVNSRKVEPGRVKVPLPEGRMDLIVVARDRYGNESRWKKNVLVDRTRPEISLRGEVERGIGRQEIVFDFNETVASVTCFGKTIKPDSKSVRLKVDLKPGRRRVVVVARDRAGNTGRAAFVLKAVNKVLLLDGKSAVRIDIPLAVARLEKFTIECWVRGFEVKGRILLLEKGGRTDGFAIFWSRQDRTLPYGLMVAHGVGLQTLPARRPWKWERWTHLALSYDGTKIRFFVNGSLNDSVAPQNPFRPGKAPLFLGCGSLSRGRPGYFFKGAVDELRLSRTARYTRGFSPRRYLNEDKDTVLFLRFDAMERDRFKDSSGNKLHARAVGRPRIAEETR